MNLLHGSCHCGNVKFTIKCEEGLQGLRRCNCSLCKRRGAVVAVVAKSDLTVTEGEQLLSSYQWNTKTAKHHFCSNCGIYTYHIRRIDPQTLGVNVGCIDSVDVFKLDNIEHTDGTSMSTVKEAE